MRSRTQVNILKSEVEQWSAHGALELEAAAALLMLRYQYDFKISCTNPQMTPPSPSPPPPAAVAVAPDQAIPEVPAVSTAETDKCTPKEQVRSVAASSQPLKKRSIPPHLLRRSLTPIVAGGKVTKAKPKIAAAPAAPCNKALLKSCRNMIREFLDNQELI